MMTQERALEILEKGGQMFGPSWSDVCTAEERAEVDARWKELPGDTSWHDALLTIAYPREFFEADPERVLRTYNEQRAARIAKATEPVSQKELEARAARCRAKIDAAYAQYREAERIWR